MSYFSPRSDMFDMSSDIQKAIIDIKLSYRSNALG